MNSTTTGGFNVSVHSITSLTAAEEYFVRVKAHRSGTGDAKWSTIESASTWFDAPTTLGANRINFSSLTGTGFTVDWPTVANADGYEIQWATRQIDLGSNNVDEGTTTAATRNYPITGLTPGTQYYVRVRATRMNAHEALWSSGADTIRTLTAAPGQVGGLMVDIDGRTATLSWGAVSGAASYNVEYSIGVTDVWVRSSVTDPTVTTSITGLTLGQTYGFRVGSYQSPQQRRRMEPTDQ